MYWNKRYRKWEARLTLGGKQRYLGSFAEEADAAEAVEAARAAHAAGRLDQHLAKPKSYKVLHTSASIGDR